MAQESLLNKQGTEHSWVFILIFSLLRSVGSLSAHVTERGTSSESESMLFAWGPNRFASLVRETHSPSGGGEGAFPFSRLNTRVRLLGSTER